MVKPKHQKDNVDEGPKKIRLRSKSNSAKIILHLLDNGPTSGSDLASLLKLKHSAGAYIQPHFQCGRVLIYRPPSNTAIYSMSPDFTHEQFTFY